MTSRTKIAAAAAMLAVTAFVLEPATAETDPMVQTPATSRPLCPSICAVIPMICEACCPPTTPEDMWTSCWFGPTFGIHGWWSPTPGINQLACTCEVRD